MKSSSVIAGEAKNPISIEKPYELQLQNLELKISALIFILVGSTSLDTECNTVDRNSTLLVASFIVGIVKMLVSCMGQAIKFSCEGAKFGSFAQTCLALIESERANDKDDGRPPNHLAALISLCLHCHTESLKRMDMPLANLVQLFFVFDDQILFFYAQAQQHCIVCGWLPQNLIVYISP